MEGPRSPPATCRQGCRAAKSWFLWLLVPAFGSEAHLQFQCDTPVLVEGCAAKLPALRWPGAARVSLGSKGWCRRTHAPFHSASHQSHVSGYNGVSCATFSPAWLCPAARQSRAEAARSLVPISLGNTSGSGPGGRRGGESAGLVRWRILIKASKQRDYINK